MKNNNGAIARKLTRRAFVANKKRNFFIAVAIILTAFMLTSVFSVGISLIETLRLNPFRFEGTLAHMGVPNITPEQMQILEGLDYVRTFGKSAWVGSVDLPGFDYPVGMMHIDEITWYQFSTPTYANIVGRFAQGSNEIMMSRHKLSQMGIENPYIGMAIPMSVMISGYEFSETFILSAIYTEFVSVRGGSSIPIFVSQDFVYRHGLHFDYHPDLWGVQVIFRSQARAFEYAERLAHDLGLADNWMLGVHPAVLITANVNPLSTYMVMGVIIAFLILTGFLLIYNVMYISVSKDIRFYGLLKTLGTTPHQLRRIVNGQMFLLYLIGLPIGLGLAAAMSFVLVPAMIASTIDTIVSFSPIIYIGGALFTLLTAFLGAHSSAKKAARVSPIEAVRYAGEQSANINVRRSTNGSPAKMAFRNVFRERKRAAIVLVSLFLGVSVFTISMTIANSMDIDSYINAMFDHDFLLESRPFNGFSAETIAEIHSIAGISEIRPEFLTAGIVAYNEQLGNYVDLLEANRQDHIFFNPINRNDVVDNGLMFMIRGIDMDWFVEWNQRQEAPFGETEISAFGRGEMVLASNFRFRFLYEVTLDEAQQILPADTELRMAIGFDEIDEPIYKDIILGGVVEGFDTRRTVRHNLAIVGGVINNSQTELFVSAPFLQSLLGEDLRINALHINVEYGWDESVAAALYILLDESNVVVLSRHEARLAALAARQTLFILGAGISTILGAIGVFNFINVISVGLLVRKREFAALESVGMTKRQMKSMLGWEGAIYWITTLSLAITIGNAIAIGLFTLLRNSGEPQFTTLIYPFIPITAAYAIIISVCSITPKIAYRGIGKSSLVERLREVE